MRQYRLNIPPSICFNVTPTLFLLPCLPQYLDNISLHRLLQYSANILSSACANIIPTLSPVPAPISPQRSSKCFRQYYSNVVPNACANITSTLLPVLAPMPPISAGDETAQAFTNDMYTAAQRSYEDIKLKSAVRYGWSCRGARVQGVEEGLKGTWGRIGVRDLKNKGNLKRKRQSSRLGRFGKWKGCLGNNEHVRHIWRRIGCLELVMVSCRVYTRMKRILYLVILNEIGYVVKKFIIQTQKLH